MSRRAFVQASAATAAAAGVVGGGVATGLAGSSAAQADEPTGLFHDWRDLKHVVVLMQENRSYDHYFGMLPGARGFGDKQGLQFPDGTDVFRQPDSSRSDGGYLLPFRMDSSKMNALSGWDLDHTWPLTHEMWNQGRYDRWVPAKTNLCMGYYTEDDLPFQHAVAHAWMVADHSFHSIMSATHPNRLYNYTGQIGITGTTPGTTAAYDNNENSNLDWPTFADQLLTAGIAKGMTPSDVYWAYQNNGTSGDGDKIGTNGDNPNQWFTLFNTWASSGAPALQAAAIAAGIGQPSDGAAPSDAGSLGPEWLEWVLADFITDCANDTLPLVATMASPSVVCEHPANGDRGAHYVNRVIEALASNPDVWNSTLLIVTYDEADGLFDHVPPPFPEDGEPREYLPQIGGNVAGHIGPGPRVPTMLISPWTRGGKAYSGALDHTSYQQFAEEWLAATQGLSFTNVNITAWRRAMFNNLGAALDFANPDFATPTLPDTNAILAQYDLDATLPAVAPPAVGRQSMPTPDSDQGVIAPVPSPYQQHADVVVDRSAGTVTASMTNTATPSGLSSGVCHQVYPDAHKPFRATPFTLKADGTARTYVWDATDTQGEYAFSIYGPDRFVRRFAGTVVPAEDDLAGVADVAAVIQPATQSSGAVLQLTLSNLGMQPLEFTLVANDYEGGQQTVFVEGDASAPVAWPTDASGFYDVIVTDSSDTGFMRRYAGRIN